MPSGGRLGPTAHWTWTATSSTVAPPITNGVTGASAPSAAPIPAAVGPVITVDAPPVTDKNSVVPTPSPIDFRVVAAAIFAAGQSVHSCQALLKFVARLYKLKNFVAFPSAELL